MLSVLQIAETPARLMLPMAPCTKSAWLTNTSTRFAPAARHCCAVATMVLPGAGDIVHQHDPPPLQVLFRQRHRRQIAAALLDAHRIVETLRLRYRPDPHCMILHPARARKVSLACCARNWPIRPVAVSATALPIRHGLLQDRCAIKCGSTVTNSSGNNAARNWPTTA